MVSIKRASAAKPAHSRALAALPAPQTLEVGTARLYPGDALRAYADWVPPVCIISDGPYGLGKFPGEPLTVDALAEWYAPHIAAWSASARPDTTLWFWNSEIGWAKVHPILELHGWEYQECCIWNKGIAHVAGNCNSKTIRGMPVVTEVAIRYTRRMALPSGTGETLPLKQWLRAEWQRSGLPLSKSNEACRVANAATRKYLTQCHLWYFPPGEAVQRMAEYCCEHGYRTERPYFSIDGINPVTANAWERLRAKWNHTHGITNVWDEPPVHGGERIRARDAVYLHANQKPLALMERQIVATTDAGDVLWEPFGGLCSASVAALRTGRRPYAAEVNPEYFEVAKRRLSDEVTGNLDMLRDNA
jgi:hypothetical protein